MLLRFLPQFLAVSMVIAQDKSIAEVKRAFRNVKVSHVYVVCLHLHLLIMKADSSGPQYTVGLPDAVGSYISAGLRPVS